jgi:alkaline phosphatase D
MVLVMNTFNIALGWNGVGRSSLALLVCTGLVRAAQPFAWGVAAGDVTPTAAILWTRADAPGGVQAELATDADFTQIARMVPVLADEDSDLTVKVDVSGLTPATTYYYRFVREDDPSAVSRVGRFRTAPDSAATAFRFVFTGDSNFAFSPLTAAAHAAREQADFLIWFGDTIYGDVPSGGLGVASDLAGYRGKYRQLRSDAHLQALLAGLAVRVGWDDHEVRNDYAGLDPALSPDRKLAGYRAFFEYMPIRPQGEPDDPYRTYRRFRYGPNVEFFLLDERQYREVSAAGTCGSNPDPDGFLLGWLTRDPACQDVLRAPREMLGPVQFEWLRQGLLTSTARTKFIINNVPLTHIALLPYDRWDGYDAQRRALLEFIDAHRIEGVVFLTTDTHANAFNPDLGAYFRRNRPDYVLDNGVVIPEIIAGPIGTETLRDELLTFAGALLGAPEVGVVRLMLGLAERMVVERIRALNHLSFIADDRIGYARFDVNADGSWQATFRGMTADAARREDGEIETLYSTDDGPLQGPGLPCCLPVPLAVVLAGIALPRLTRK